jgi:hypothetical protein
MPQNIVIITTICACLFGNNKMADNRQIKEVKEKNILASYHV